MTVSCNAASWATGSAVDAVLFALLYTGMAPVIGIPFENSKNVVSVIEDASIDSLNVAVMLILAGAVGVVGNVEITEGGIASIMPVIGATVTLGTVPTVADITALAVLSSGPDAA